MKKILALIITTILLFCSATPAKSQTVGRLYNNDFSMSYGQISFPQTIYVLGEVFGIILTAGHFNPQNTIFVGQFGFDYTKWVGNNVGVGAMIVNDYMTSTVGEDGQSDYKMFVISMLPTFKASWFNYEHVGMYSKVGAGVSLFLGGDEPQVSPTFQISPVCVDFGWYNVRAFVELGYGAQGVCGGLKFTL